ncbi:hypothetical protein ACI2LF_13030 [Kribbella sp. NPDC020789]
MPGIEIDALTTYLDEAGWSPTGLTWQGGAIWARGEYEVLLPPRAGMDDASSRVRELLLALADAEQRSPAEIARDVANPLLDRASFQAGAEPGIDGFVTLPAGMEALEGIRDMVYAVAAPSTTFLRTSVEDRLEATLLVPATGDRRVLKELYVAASAVHAAVRNDAVDEASAAEVPADFCTALARLAGPGDAGVFELEFHWARGVPSGLPNAALTFGPGSGERIRRVGRSLERGPDEPSLPADGPASVEGRVTGLQDSGSGADRWRVRIRGVVTSARDEAPTRTIWAQLASQDQYEQAWQAHRQDRPVRIDGEWTAAARPRLRADPDGLAVQPDP